VSIAQISLNKDITMGVMQKED